MIFFAFFISKNYENGTIIAMFTLVKNHNPLEKNLYP